MHTTKTATTLAQLELACAQNCLIVPLGPLSREQRSVLGRTVLGWLGSSARTLPRFDPELLDPKAAGLSEGLVDTLLSLAYLTPVLYMAAYRQDRAPPVVSAPQSLSHMWLNAFQCVHPTPDTYAAVGDWIMKELDQSDGATILRINKS